jgi:hypothetical protein
MTQLKRNFGYPAVTRYPMYHAFFRNKHYMKYYYLFLLNCCLSLTLFAQSPGPYASVRISLLGKNMSVLVRTGIETDHGQYYPGRSITTVLSPEEIQRVQNAGFQTEILIPDLTQHYLQQRSQPRPARSRGDDCSPQAPAQSDYVTPENYSYGSMGGYLTYDQMMAELDKMRLLFPNLISVRNITSDTIVTWDGHPIYNVKISDNPDTDEPERAVLYTALHHAREPNSASQLIFFMWYLLENYTTRDDIKALVNNLEMYFVPCINVDGYKYNETTNPDGGGFWRKNRRDNGDGSYGVDLNRNYGYFWGDFGGSSPDPSSEIYRGPEAFSEPESRTIRDFCRAHEFLFAYNYHTSGNLFIYPWAYSDSPADTAFIQYARHFTRENNYHYGTTSETVGYNVNGSSDDWMYSEIGAYSFTPEIGTTGFWPMPDEIDGLNKDNLWQNLSMAYSALQYGDAKDLSSAVLASLQGNINIEVTRYGLLDGPIGISLIPFSSNISATSASQSFDEVNLSKSIFTFTYELTPSVAVGDELIFLLKTDNGLWIKTDTLRKNYGVNSALTTTVSLQDNLNNAANWNGNWAITNETYFSASKCMTDSPNGSYQPDASKICHLIVPQAIPTNATSATLTFFAKWNIEEDWDFVQVVGLGNNNFSKALCGHYTETGLNTQSPGPVFDGNQSMWVEETMDLSDFIGQSVQVDFVFGSDGAVEADGFYFDDVRIAYALPTSGTNATTVSTFTLTQNEPNPAADFTVIEWTTADNSSDNDATLLVYNTMGVVVAEKTVKLNTEKRIILDTSRLAPGIYTYLIRHELGQSSPQKMTVVR